MDILTALKISLFDFAIVFVTLMLIAFFIKIVSLIISYFENSKKEQDVIIEEVNTTVIDNSVVSENVVGYGELKLFGVDEKTAAMIMAIVSDESKIPLAELQFKSIKLLEN
jgi:Na+-transporting methylmalonyl-CoA/oxaloacetate decarboxylase gamma subunit